MKAALVITTISPPNHVLRACAAGCREHGIDFIVIGDRKSPLDFHLEGCDYWSIERQQDCDLPFARLLPEGHYARKNLGYLLAMRKGAEIIIETDDDNLPLEGFWNERPPWQLSRRVAGPGWFNPYSNFTGEHIWPRGFPLEALGNPLPIADSQPERCYCPIQQGLTNGDPDVDAVYRLTRPLPITFDNNGPVALGRGSWAPFNSQNTTWFREAFPLLYLPSFCSFRMTDIWRSFIAQRICRANDWDILYHGPTVYQDRNPHDLLHDFTDEIPGYLNNAAICRALDEIDLRPGVDSIPEGLTRCYEAFIAHGLIQGDEIDLLRSWLSMTGNVLPKQLTGLMKQKSPGIKK